MDKAMKKQMKIQQFFNKSGTMASELAHEQKHAKWKSWSQDEANMGHGQAKVNKNLAQEGQYQTGRLVTDSPGSENRPMVGSRWG